MNGRLLFALCDCWVEHRRFKGEIEQQNFYSMPLQTLGRDILELLGLDLQQHRSCKLGAGIELCPARGFVAAGRCHACEHHSPWPPPQGSATLKAFDWGQQTVQGAGQGLALGWREMKFPICACICILWPRSAWSLSSWELPPT